MTDRERKLPPFENKGTSSVLKTCFNTINALSGIGIITIPYTLKETGWFSLALLLVMAIVTCFTALLIKWSMDYNPSIKNYSDIGYYAFGPKGRTIISVFKYVELYLVPTGFLILEGDNLHKLFPHVDNIGGHHLGGKQLFITLAAVVILPTMWLKDLKWLSYVSAGAIVSTLVTIISIFWVGAFDGVGFHAKGKGLDIGGVPLTIGLYAFCYGTHPVFPTLYTSMKDKTHFSKVLIISFTVTTVLYTSMAIIGYLMFGHHTLSQITLNLPTSKVSSKIAIYTVLINPVAKYALIITPVAHAIENQLPDRYNNRAICILVRTLLVISTVIVALVFPFFALLVALIGAVLNVSVSVLLPCICYLKISGAYKTRGFKTLMICGVIVVGFAVGVMGTYSSMKGIIEHLQH